MQKLMVGKLGSAEAALSDMKGPLLECGKQGCNYAIQAWDVFSLPSLEHKRDVDSRRA